MIQIYKKENVNYNRNGDLVPDTISAESTISLNGDWEMELTVPLTDENVEVVTDYAVVKVRQPEAAEDQLWYIYKTERTDDEITAYARPVFMQAAEDCILLDVRPTGKTGQQALDIMCGQNQKYSGESDITTAATAYYQNKNLIEAIQGDEENAFLNRWGGEILYNNYQVIINERVGGDYGVRAEMGYNIAGIEESVDTQEVVTRIFPIGFNGRMLTGATPYADSKNISKYPFIHSKFSKYEDIKYVGDVEREEEKEEAYQTIEEFEEALRERAQSEFSAGADIPAITYNVDFLELSETQEYKNLKSLLKVGLGDTVKIRHRRLQIETEARCIARTYDHIRNRITEITLGNFEKNYLDKMSSVYITASEVLDIKSGTVLADRISGILNAMNTQLAYQREVAEQQEVRAILFADMVEGSPTYGAMCIGTKGLEIAKERTQDGKDWKWETAITADGINANAIVTGLLADKTGKNYWNLDTGDFRLSGESYIGDITVDEALQEIADAKTLQIILSNEYQGIPVDSDGNYAAFPECSTTVTVLRGTEDISGSVSYGIKANNITGNWNASTKTYTVTGLTADNGYAEITVTYLGTISAKKRFEISKIRDGAPGAPGESVVMETSAPIIRKETGEVLIPGTVTFSAFKISESGRTPYSGYFKIEESPDGTTWTTVYQSEAAESAVVYNTYNFICTEALKKIITESNAYIMSETPASVQTVRCTLYADAQKTQTIDMATVPVVRTVESLTPNEIFNLLTNNGEIKGIYQEGNQLYINATYIKSGTLVLGGKNNGRGNLTILDENDQVIGTLNNQGAILQRGSFKNISGTSEAEMNYGQLTFRENGSLIGDYRIVGWAGTDPKEYGMSVQANNKFLSLGCGMTSAGYRKADMLINNGLNPDGITETIIIYGSARTSREIIIANASDEHGRLYFGDNKEAYIGIGGGIYEGIQIDPGGFGEVVRCEAATIINGSLVVTGQKNRQITTKSYGDRKMNAVETAEAFFCDVGSATIGEEGYVTIFEDQIFAETIESESEYHVFLTRTNEKEVKYTEKEKDFFRVYGETGATFDWIIYAKQLGYGATRMEEGKAFEQEIKFDETIFASDEAAVNLVEQAIYQHEGEVTLL